MMIGDPLGGDRIITSTEIQLLKVIFTYMKYDVKW